MNKVKHFWRASRARGPFRPLSGPGGKGPVRSVSWTARFFNWQYPFNTVAGGCPGNFALTGLPSVACPRLYEITYLPSWLYCFLPYVSIRTHDPATHDQLAYARLLIWDAQHHGGSGWLDYDHLFQQRVAINPSLQWNMVHSGLLASTIWGQQNGPSVFCTLCRESDHMPEQCALLYLQPHPSWYHSCHPSWSAKW